MTHLLFDLLFEVVLYQLKQIKLSFMKFSIFHIKEKKIQVSN